VQADLADRQQQQREDEEGRDEQDAWLSGNAR
jgi:hypothetical protein